MSNVFTGLPVSVLEKELSFEGYREDVAVDERKPSKGEGINNRFLMHPNQMRQQIGNKEKVNKKKRNN